MTSALTRRAFLSTVLTGSGALCLSPWLAAAQRKESFSFLLLGDLHYDKLEHHDLAWLEKDKPDDLRQVREYSQITANIQPKLFATLRKVAGELNQAPESRLAFTAQVGDFVEGLCGSEKLASEQNRDAIVFVRGTKLGTPFLFAKGNHDITGTGAVEAFKKVFHPFIKEETAALGKTADLGEAATACWAVEYGDALFCFYDAYQKESLTWLEATLARRSARHCFVLLHPPVVPYGARSTWYLFSTERERAQRERLLGLLGKHRAIVLSGHIHRYNLIARGTPGGGRFVQLAISSVVPSAEVRAKNTLFGVKEYNPDQVKVEPNFSPANEAQRRAVYEIEAPFVKEFEYADMPGYAVIGVREGRVTAKIYAGITRTLWRELDLSGLLGS